MTKFRFKKGLTDLSCQLRFAHVEYDLKPVLLRPHPPDSSEELLTVLCVETMGETCIRQEVIWNASRPKVSCQLSSEGMCSKR